MRPLDREYLDAFYLLSASRQTGMAGPQPIAISEILLFAKEGVEIDLASERLKYVRLVQQLDRTYLAFWAEKNKTSKP